MRTSLRCAFAPSLHSFTDVFRCFLALVRGFHGVLFVFEDTNNTCWRSLGVVCSFGFRVRRWWLAMRTVKLLFRNPRRLDFLRPAPSRPAHLSTSLFTRAFFHAMST